MSLRRFIINTSAMSFVNVFRLLAQFFAVPILSRLLSPADYGLVGMAMPFMMFAMMIGDAGIATSLVRCPAKEWKVWSTCFWLSAFLGIISGGLMAGCALIVAHAFKEPRLAPIVAALAFGVMAQAFVSIPGALLQERHQFKNIAGSELTAVLIGIAAAVVSALNGMGAWALVVQQLAFYGTRLVLITAFASFRPRMVFHWQSAKEHVFFGRDVFGINLISFFTRSLDNVAIGKVLGAAPVGLYSMAFQFVRLPSMIITGPLQYVLYPQLAKIKHDKLAIKQTFLLLTRVLATVIFPSVGMLTAAYKPVFDLLLSVKWSASGELFMIVAPVGALQAVASLVGTMMMVQGRTDIQLRTTVEAGILWIGSLTASVWFGISCVALAYDVAVLLYLPRSLYLTLPVIGCRTGPYAKTLAVPAIVTLGAVCCFEGLKSLTVFSEWEMLGVAMLIGVLAIALGGLVQWRYLVTELEAIDFVPIEH